ncbi:MAG: peptidoglycan DD-metalloendopeptidase family protein [Thiohalomonadales bacterium]
MSNKAQAQSIGQRQQQAAQRQRRVKRSAKRSGMSRVHWMILMVSTSLFSVIFFLISDIAEATRLASLKHSPMTNFNTASLNTVSLPLKIPHAFNNEGNSALVDNTLQAQINTAIAKLTTAAESATPLKKVSLTVPNMQWKKLTIEKGDTVSKIFTRLKLNPKELHQIVRLGEVTKTLNRISPGEELKFLTIDGKLHELIYEIDDSNSLHIRRENKKYIASTVNTDLDKRIAYATATINQSLFMAAQEAGMPGSMTMELANIFDWNINFVLDVRTGDRFSVIYEEFYLDGKKISNGDILAAEFVNNNKVYRAVRYLNQYGQANYYAPSGKSMRRAFLRTPVDFTRISSKFGKRYHPVLNRMRAHHGVDYAAPSGTPIKAAGDGKVIHMGKKGGYGKTIILQHGGKYSTLYAHMKNFKRGLKKGSKVKQGQIIGYVGRSGLATGPHLHYEFRVDGKHRNPLTVKLPGAMPITTASRLDFKLNTQGYLTLLDTLGTTSVAMR